MLSNKYLFFSPFRIGSVSFEVVFDMILKIIESDDNNEVTVLTCNGFLKNCSSNMEGSKLKCQLCSMSSNYLFEKYEHKRIKIIDLGNYTNKINKNKPYFTYNSFDDLKKIKYKGINIGMGVVSSFVSYSRDLNFDSNNFRLKTINNLLLSSCKLIDILDILPMDYKNYQIKIFNGRLSELRSFFNYFGGKVNTIEYIHTKIKNQVRRVEFESALPHSIEENTRRNNLNWNNYSNEDRIEIAKDFFDRKLSNTSFQDSNYTKNQEKHKLPENFDDRKVNISYFISSEDEVFAVGGRWDEDKLFKKQIDFLDFWISNFKNKHNYQLYVRMHPNLKGLNFNYVTDYYNYNIQNITILKPTSSVSSYELMFKSQSIIVSSSSIGFEANYFGIPSIQIGASWYSDLNISHKPRTLDELKIMIENRSLKPLDKIDSMKMALYLASPPSEKLHKLKDISYVKKFYRFNILNSYNFPLYYSWFNILFRLLSIKSLIFKIRLNKLK